MPACCCYYTTCHFFAVEIFAIKLGTLHYYLFVCFFINGSNIIFQRSAYWGGCHSLTYVLFPSVIWFSCILSILIFFFLFHTTGFSDHHSLSIHNQPCPSPYYSFLCLSSFTFRSQVVSHLYSLPQLQGMEYILSHILLCVQFDLIEISP